MAKVTEQYIPFEIDEKGEVTSEIKIYVVAEGDLTVGRFFPETDTDKETKAKADAFAKSYKKVEVLSPDYIKRKPGKGNK